MKKGSLINEVFSEHRLELVETLVTIELESSSQCICFRSQHTLHSIRAQGIHCCSISNILFNGVCRTRCNFNFKLCSRTQGGIAFQLSRANLSTQQLTLSTLGCCFMPITDYFNRNLCLLQFMSKS